MVKGDDQFVCPDIGAYGGEKGGTAPLISDLGSRWR